MPTFHLLLTSENRQPRTTYNVHISVYVLSTTAVHIVIRNSSVNLPSFAPDKHQDQSATYIDMREIHVETVYNTRVYQFCSESESWTVTQKTIDRLQVFVNKCLRRILDIRRPDRISNKEL